MTTVRPTTSQGVNLPVSTARNARPAMLSSGGRSPRVTGMLPATRVIMSSGIRKVRAAAVAALVDVKGEKAGVVFRSPLTSAVTSVPPGMA